MARNWVAAFGLLLAGCGDGGSQGGVGQEVGGMYEKNGGLAPGAYTATGSGSHPNSCPDTCPSNTTYYSALETQMQQFFSSYVDGLNGSAPVPTTSQPIHEMARGMVKHLTMHPGEGWTTESQNGSTTPEGWTLATRLSMMGIQTSPTLFTEVLVTVSNTSGNATTDAQAAVNTAVQQPEAAQAVSAVAVGAGAWAGPDPNSLIVSIIYQHQ